MKKALFVLLASLLLPGAALAQGKVRIGVSIPTADHGWTGGINWWAQKAIKDWQAKDKDVQIFLVTADNPQKQVNDVEDLMTKGIQALVILAHDSATLTPVVKKAYERGSTWCRWTAASPSRCSTCTSPATTRASARSAPSGSGRRSAGRATS